MSKLTGDVAVVSGSGRGIGRAIALKLAAEGASVVVNDIDPEPAGETVDLIRSRGGRAAATVGDVTAPDFAQRFVGTALETFGGLDIIVNNAGYTWDSVIQKMTDEQWHTMLEVHLTAPFRILRAASEYIRSAAKTEAGAGPAAGASAGASASRPKHRRVVNISSNSGLFGNAGQVNYASAKAALIGLTRTLAKEWGRYNVTVNCVAYGLIETRLTQSLSSDRAEIDITGRTIKVGLQSSLIETLNRLVPLGRPGTPEEAADAVYLFCSPESRYISGQIVSCSGGLLL
ncbi:MAG TPA: SDR family oxidoreductase [Steroidobacteraceae bacterium]|nr:SDR family oxidoreductase [Steroidobacteraceae bacterium]